METNQKGKLVDKMIVLGAAWGECIFHPIFLVCKLHTQDEGSIEEVSSVK